MQRQKKKRTKKHVPRIQQEQPSGSRTLMVTEFSTPSFSSSDSNIVLSPVQLDSILLPRYRKRNLIKTTCGKPKHKVEKKKKGGFPKTIPLRSVHKELQCTTNTNSSTSCETRSMKLKGSKTKDQKGFSFEQYVTEIPEKNRKSKYLSLKRKVSPHDSPIFSEGYSRLIESKSIDSRSMSGTENSESCNMEKFRTHPNVTDEGISTRLGRYSRSAHSGESEVSIKYPGSASRSLPPHLEEHSGDVSDMLNNIDNLYFSMESEKSKTKVDAGVSPQNRCPTPEKLPSNKEDIDVRDDAEEAYGDFPLSPPETMQMNLSDRSEEAMDSKTNFVNLQEPKAFGVDFIVAQVETNDDSKPEASNRKNISPFIRERSSIVGKSFRGMLSDEETKAETEAQEDTNRRISVSLYNELLDRIHQLELQIEKQEEYTAMNLNLMKNRISRDRLESGTNQEDRQSERSGGFQIQEPGELLSEMNRYVIMYSLTTVLGFFIIILMYSWLSEYMGGLDIHESQTLQNWHHFLMIIGLLFLNSQSTLIFRTANYLPPSRNTSKRFMVAFVIHMVLQTVTFILCAMSMRIIYVTVNDMGKFSAHLYTLHSWVGLCTLTLYLAQFISGFLIAIPRIEQKVCTIHNVLGNICMVFIITTCLLGILELAWWRFPQLYNEQYWEGYFVNILGATIVIFGSLVMFLTQEDRD